MNKKFFGKIISFLTAAALTMTYAVPIAVSAQTNSGKIIIASESDFAEFVKSCVLDSNTRGKTYSLECDIRLTSDFTPIPTFCGTFEGNDHTISALNITGSGSDMGLFRYIEKEGTVKDLNVQGRTAPSGSASECGGIAGVNRGKIQNCTFSGMVSGKERCGGIAGVNEKTGLIENCKITGLVQARHYTGGIVGENLGTVQKCENEASVNVMAYDESTDLDNINIEDIYSTENAAEITDEGGIAGYSSGNIQNCINRGNIGYIHVGYNVGGIAGRQEGYISGCENYGVINGRKDTGGIAGQAEPHISLMFEEHSIDRLREQLEELNNLIDSTINDIEANAEAISAGWEEIYKELENVKELSDEFLDKTETIINDNFGEDASIIDPPNFSGTDDEIVDLRDRLSAAIDNIADLGKYVGDTTNAAMDNLVENLRRINDMTSDISDTLLDIVEEVNNISADISDHISDISDQDTPGFSEGKIDGCKNYGEVNGDLYAGGIVGSMAIEYDFDPEGDLETSGSHNANFVFQSKDVVRDSINYGEVISKKGRAGGIVGGMSMGCLINCVGLGDVSTDDGSYTGGIAGNSEAAIHDCSAKCRISGKSFVGGIAGAAYDMKNCKSFVVIEEGIERIGAIAGYSGFEGKLENNTFIDSGIGAVDGISYGGIAYPISYDQMIALENTPKEFGIIELTFISDDETVKVIPVKYGESPTAADIPEVPEKEGKFGKWEEFVYDNIIFSARINAVYENFITALESAEKRENGLPIFVAEGNFTDGDSISVTENKDMSESWSITLPNDGAETHRIRFLPEIKPSKASVTVTENGVLRTAEAEIDGKYLVVEISGNSAILAVSEKDSAALISYIVFGALAVAVLIVIVIVIGKNKKASIADKK